MIKIKCNYLNGAVAVPTELIDKHLKLASGASFKVLLFILRNPDSAMDAKQIGMCTGLSESDVKMCLEFWESCGAVEVTDEVVTPEKLEEAASHAKLCQCESAPVQEEKRTVSVRSLPVKKPTQREVALRISKEPNLQIVCTEAQSILGTFGYDTQGLLVMIYDYYGFPPEVIITLLQLQKNKGATSSSAIKSRAEDWAKRGICTLELMEEELLALEKTDRVFEEIKKDAGLKGDAPTPRIAKFLRNWAVEWNCSAELILYALSECDNVFSDANKLLKKLTAKGITTPEEAREKSKKDLPQEVKKSYDTDKVGKTSVMDWVRRYADKEEDEE